MLEEVKNKEEEKPYLKGLNLKSTYPSSHAKELIREVISDLEDCADVWWKSATGGKPPWKDPEKKYKLYKLRA
jgi:hypothetical protein